MGCLEILVGAAEEWRTYQSRHLRSIARDVMHLRAMVNPGARERRLMSCLGDPSRFQLVNLLIRGERCVSDLAQKVGLSQSCTTRHLQALQREQIVSGERDGKRVMFHLRLDEPEVGALVAWAISERVGGRGERLFPPAEARRRKRARPPAGGIAIDPPRVHTVATEVDPSPPIEQPAAPEPAPRRAPRQELEDYLL